MLSLKCTISGASGNIVFDPPGTSKCTFSQQVQGEEGIVPLHTFRYRLPVRGDHPMRRSGQEDPNNFFTDQMSNFWLPCRVRCPEGRSEGLWAAPLSKAARPPIEHDERSFSMWRSTNPSKGAKASITRSLVPPSVSRAVQCKRSNRTAKNVGGWHWKRPPFQSRTRETLLANYFIIFGEKSFTHLMYLIYPFVCFIEPL